MSESNPIFLSPDDDPNMLQASQRARQTFRFFWRELSWERRRIIPGLDLAAVKAAFSDPPEQKSSDPNALEVEQMWCSDIHFDGRQITGTLLNDPHSLQSISAGDTVTLAPKQVNDWMYAIGSDVYGGFTVDVLRQQMAAGERKQHDQAWGLNFGDPGVIHVVPPSYLGEESPAGKGFFSRFKKVKQQPQNFKKAATTEHPMSVNMRESLEEAISENPEMLTQTDDHGFNFLHQLALAGSLDGVDVCLKHGADRNVPTHKGLTPFQLAKCLGWKKVMARLEQKT